MRTNLKKVIAFMLTCCILFGIVSVYPISAVTTYSTGEAGIALIKKYEGCELTAYKDSVGVWTIGYGHTANVTSGMTISQAQADEYLRSDLAQSEGYVNKFLSNNNISISQNQFDALVSWTFNLGNRWVQTEDFKLRTYLKNGVENYTDDEIRTAFTNWNKAGGVVLEGLINRRNAEADLFLSKTVTSDNNYTDSQLSDIKSTVISNDNKTYVNKALLYYLRHNDRVKRNLDAGKSVVFFFDGCSDNVFQSGYNCKTNHMSAYVAVVKLVNGTPKIVYENENSSTIPDNPTMVNNTTAGNNGTDMPTVVDGIHDILTKNHQGKYAALHLSDSSGNVNVIRCNGTKYSSSTSAAINIHARSWNNVSTTTYSSVGCFNVGVTSPYTEYNNFIYQITGQSNARSSTFSSVGADMGIAIVDRQMFKTSLCTLYGNSSAVEAITSYSNDLCSSIWNEPLLDEDDDDEIYPSDGYYILASALDNNKCIDIDASASGNGANAQIWDRTGGTNQIYKIKNEGGFYSIKVYHSGLSLDVNGASSQSGTNLQQWEYHGGEAQQWHFYNAGDGNVYIKSVLGTAIDVADANTTNGNNVRMFTMNYSNAQKFRLISAREPDIPISLHSWFSYDGYMPEHFYTGDMIYLNYELFHSETKESINKLCSKNYSCYMEILDSNGNIVNQSTYTNSDGNWIAFKTDNTGVYTGKVVVTGDISITSEVSISVEKNPDDFSITLSTWFSYDGYVPEHFYTGDRVFLNFELYNSDTKENINKICNKNYSCYMEILDSNGNIVNQSTYTNSDGNWIAFIPDNAGVYTGKVVVTGDISVSCQTSVKIESNADTEKPSATVTVTDNVASSQIVTLNMSDNKELAGYYWGTNSSKSPTFTSVSGTTKTVTKTINSTGTYYLTVKDTSGNVYQTSVTFVKLHLDANGGSVSTQNIIVKSGTTVELPDAEKSGVVFSGWYDSSEIDKYGLPVGNRYSGKINSNCNLYAIWTDDSVLRWGDVNNDGDITTLDIIKIVKYVNNTTECDTLHRFLADVNADGKLTSDNDGDDDSHSDAIWLNMIRLRKCTYSDLPAYKLFEGIFVYSMPKTEYIYGEGFQSDGLSIVARFSNGTKYIFEDNFTVTGYDPYTVGTQKLVIHFFNFTTTLTVNVKRVDCSVVLSSSSQTMTVGNTVKLTATTTPTGQTVTWKSSNTSVATVSSSGVVTAKSAGNAEITAEFTYNSVKYSAKCSVTVNQSVLLGDVNNDGVIDAGDSILISKYDVGLITLDSMKSNIEKAGDVNKDGVVDAGDAILVSKYDAGLISKF